MKKSMVALILILIIAIVCVGCAAQVTSINESPEPSITYSDKPGVTITNWEKIIVGTTTYDEVVALFGIKGVQVEREEEAIRTGWTEYTFDEPEAGAVVDFDYNTKVVIRKWIHITGDGNNFLEEGSTDGYPQ